MGVADRCPTCGEQGWKPKTARRRNGQARIPSNRKRKGELRPSTRVYWPMKLGQRKGKWVTYVTCPDTFHDEHHQFLLKRRKNMRGIEEEVEVEHVEHRPPKKLDRRTERAKQHRERQNKHKR